MARQKQKPSLVDRRARTLSPSLATFPIFPSDPITLERGEGQFVFDSDGRRFLDGTAQNLCISTGYAHPRTLKAVDEQMRRMAHCTTLFINEIPIRYAEALVSKMPAGSGDWVVHLVNSGAEAIDLAFLMARAHTRNFEIITLRNGYHGLHFSAAAATSFAPCRLPIPAAPGFVNVHHPDQYKGVFGPGVQPYIDELERTLFASTCGRVAGMIVEPIQGFGGVVPMPPGYMKQAFEIVRKAGGLAIVDEVQTGFGRMGTHYWGFEAHDAVPDLVVLGKGMGNGLPIAGVIARREIAQSFAQTRFFNTYGSNPVCCAAALSVIEAIEEEGLQQRANAVGARLKSGLAALQQKHPLIGDVRGDGLILGFELVRDRQSKTPAVTEGEALQKKLRERGFINVRGSPGRNVFRMNPPMCIAEEDAEAWIGAIDASLSEIAQAAR